MKQFLDITSALSDETRLRALLSLREGELCLCQIIEILTLAPSTVSKHMSVLREAGLVTARKDGRWQYYQLAETTASPNRSRFCAATPTEYIRRLSAWCCPATAAAELAAMPRSKWLKAQVPPAASLAAQPANPQ